MDNGLSLWSVEAEQSVIGGLLTDCGLWDRVADKVGAHQFIDERHSIIFKAMTWFASTGKKFDGLVVSDRLRQTNEIDYVGGGKYIGDLMKNCASHANIDAYAAIVVDRFNLRRLKAAISSCEAILNNPDTDIHEKAERASSAILDAIEDASSDTNLFTVKDGAQDLYQWLQLVNDKGGKFSGIETGFDQIDTRTNGLHGGELIIVAARPAMGKTNFALNVAGNVAKNKGRVAFFSMEMSKRELAGRFAACMSGMDYGAMQSQNWERFSGGLSDFIGKSSEYQIRIDDRATQTVERIRIAAKKAKRQLNGLDLLVVDYLQLIQGKGGSRYEQVTNISRDLKIMAKELDVPVLCLAQINRASTDRTDKRPQLSDLRDSGSIEQDADAVIFLHREDNPDGTLSSVAEAIFRKIRHGQPGTDPLMVDFNHCRFLTADRDAWIESQQAKEQAKSSKGYGK